MCIVLAVPPIIDSAPKQHVTSVGETAVIPCSARGIPEPDISWTVNGRRFDLRDPRYSIASNGSLVISNVVVGILLGVHVSASRFEFSRFPPDYRFWRWPRFCVQIHGHYTTLDL